MTSSFDGALTGLLNTDDMSRLSVVGPRSTHRRPLTYHPWTRDELRDILSSCTDYSRDFSASTSTSSSPLYSFVLLLTEKTDVCRRLLTDLFTNSIGLTGWG